MRNPCAVLDMETLVQIAASHLSHLYLRRCSVGYLLKLVHGDERVPLTVGDQEVLAALVIGVEQGRFLYPTAADAADSAPLPSTDGTPWIQLAGNLYVDCVFHG